MPKIPTHSWRVRECLLDREPFETRGAMRAIRGGARHAGRLARRDPELAEKYVLCCQLDQVAYTVLSYDTPIAWVLADGTVVQPPVKYSRTTTGHQGLLYALEDLTFDQKVDIRQRAQREREQARERRAAAYDRQHLEEPLRPMGAGREGMATPLPPAPAVPVEDPTATLEDRIAALETETFTQIADTQTVLRGTARALKGQAANDRHARAGAYRLEDIYGEEDLSI